MFGRKRMNSQGRDQQEQIIFKREESIGCGVSPSKDRPYMSQAFDHLEETKSNTNLLSEVDIQRKMDGCVTSGRQRAIHVLHQGSQEMNRSFQRFAMNSRPGT